MTGHHRVAPGEWQRLETLWDTVRGLSADQRLAVLTSSGVDDALRAELESLLEHASAAEAFFDRLQLSVPQGVDALVRDADRAIVPNEEDPRHSSPTSVGPDPTLGTTLGHYQIVERIGEGGMGRVYRAVDPRLGRTVALKLLRHPANDERAKERLSIEARAAAALDHPNICTIYEVGETTDQLPFIAMAFYPGETLEAVMRRGALPLPVALGYATQIARGLGAAHERGIIHRDVKPANIVVGADGVLKLLDFGIARIRDVTVSHDALAPGTIAYMSPEQVTSRPLDQRTDLWSLGVVVHEMFTGTRPFAGEHVGAILYAILHDVPAPASTIRGDVPEAVDQVVARLLAKDFAQRYPNAEELLADLASIADAQSPPDTAARAEAALARSAGGQERDRVAAGRNTRWVRHAVWYGAAAAALGSLVMARPKAPQSAVSDRRIAAEDLTAQGKRDVLFRTEAGRQQSLDFLTRAIAVDSTYAPAHAALAHLLVLTGEDVGGPRRERLVQAEGAARTAIRLDSSLADAHAALGHVLLFDYQLAKAEEQFKRAIEVNPREPYAREFLVWLSVFMERPHDALEHALRAEADNPNSPTAIAEVARAQLVNGRCDEALATLGRLTYFQPPPARAAAIAAQCHARRGKWQQAVAALRPTAERNPELVEPLLGFMLARAGQTEAAMQVRDRLLQRWRRGDGGAYGVAVVHAGFRDYDKAFEWLDRSIDDRSLRYNIMEPAFEDLRRDPRFDRVRRQLASR